MTGNDPSRMAESSAINKSLTTLGMVVKALNRNEVFNHITNSVVFSSAQYRDGFRIEIPS